MDGRMDVRINVGMDVSMNTVGQNLVSDRVNSDFKSTKIGTDTKIVLKFTKNDFNLDLNNKSLIAQKYQESVFLGKIN